MRQTDYSVEQVIGFLNSPEGGSLPRCCFLNELGQIAIGGDATAKAKLIELFSSSSDDMGEVYILFCYMGRLAEERRDEEVRDILSEFLANPINSVKVEHLSDLEQSAPFVELLSV